MARIAEPAPRAGGTSAPEPMKIALRCALLATASLGSLSLGCSSNASPGDVAPDAGDSGMPIPDGGPPGDGGAGDAGDAGAEAGALPALSIDPFSSAPGSAHEHEPFIAVSPQGRVAVSFASFLTGGGITVGYRISNDAGSTWGPATALRVHVFPSALRASIIDDV